MTKKALLFFPPTACYSCHFSQDKCSAGGSSKKNYTNSFGQCLTKCNGYNVTNNLLYN